MAIGNVSLMLNKLSISLYLMEIGVTCYINHYYYITNLSPGNNGPR